MNNKHNNLGLGQQCLSARLLTGDSLRSPSAVDFVRSEENYTSSKPCNPQPTAVSRHYWPSPKLIILLLVVLSLFTPSFSQAAECRLVNVLTDKSQVGAGERVQVNVTGQKECIGRTVSLQICNSTQCSAIASQTFGSRIENGQSAINPIVIFIVPSDFFNGSTSAFINAVGPFNTVKSSPFSVNLSGNVSGETSEKAKFGEFCTKTDECEEGNGLTCVGNVCVECDVNEILSTCPSNTVCQDGACVPATGETEENASQKEGESKKENALGGFPGEDLEANDVINIVIGLSCWLMRVASVLTVIFVIFVGLKFMAAQGNQTKYGEAVTSFKHVLWGVLVIYGVYVIIATVAHAVGIESFSFIPLVC